MIIDKKVNLNAEASSIFIFNVTHHFKIPVNVQFSVSSQPWLNLIKIPNFEIKSLTGHTLSLWGYIRVNLSKYLSHKSLLANKLWSIREFWGGYVLIDLSIHNMLLLVLSWYSCIFLIPCVSHNLYLPWPLFFCRWHWVLTFI